MPVIDIACQIADPKCSWPDFAIGQTHNIAAQITVRSLEDFRCRVQRNAADKQNSASDPLHEISPSKLPDKIARKADFVVRTGSFRLPRAYFIFALSFHHASMQAGDGFI